MKSRYSLILLVIVLGYLFLASALVYLSFRQSLKQAEYSTLMRLGGIVNSISTQIDGDAHTDLMRRHPGMDDISKNTQDTFYNYLHNWLKRNADANMLHTPIYTVAFDSLLQQFTFVITSAEMPYYRHPYLSAPAAYMEKQIEGAMIPMYKDEFGVWLSAFAAIKNKQGKVVALVQADEHFDSFIVTARKDAVKNLLSSLLIFILFLGVLVWVVQPMLAQERKQKNALLEAYEQVAQMDNYRKEMLANLSHDLRTPIANVLGYAETLLKSNWEQSPEATNKSLMVVAQEARRLNRMIDDLFTLSKLESGHLILDREPVNIFELVQDNLQAFEIVQKEKELQLISKLDSNLPLIDADIKWLDRVVSNLLDNAHKYVNVGGFVQVSLGVVDQRLHFKVCNSGTPIAKENLPFVFDRYFREAQRSMDSTGLGLAIVKRTIELHGGLVWAEVNNDVTTFRFTLPLPLVAT